MTTLTADSATPEQRGEDVSGRLIFAPEDAISLSLEYLPIGADPLTLLSNNNSDVELSQTSPSSPKQKFNCGVANRRYLQCPALVTIAHLKKFLGLKYSVDMTRYNIDICHRRAPLPEHWTLMDVAYIFAWKRVSIVQFWQFRPQEWAFLFKIFSALICLGALELLCYARINATAFT
jgi:polycomb group RING finger protein 4